MKKINLKNKKAQAWYLDLSIGALLFIITLSLFLRVESNIMGDSSLYDELSLESRLVSDKLVSEGYPQSWDKDSVYEIGLLSKGRINQTKLDYFNEISQSDYPSSKRKLGTKFDYYVYLEDKDDNFYADAGKPGINSTNVLDIEEPKHLIKVVRLVVYDSEAMRLVLYIWS